uniref:Ima1_N domain-containing protein n=1 Tax=Angiostrongylus cantonensis TaxID=6313 RepID=A0A0K0DG79_ANGCA
MEVIVAVAACVVTPLVYRSLRYHFYTKVNCWFCQHDQRVPFEQQNSFICASCEQYNGFDESGGYNRKIPGQHCVVAVKPTRRFCTSNMKGSGSNGLCDNCNRQQEIILRRIAEFEPSDDNHWNEEVEIYRYKLNKAYPLCVRCTFVAQDKMQQEKWLHFGCECSCKGQY